MHARQRWIQSVTTAVRLVCGPAILPLTLTFIVDGLGGFTAFNRWVHDLCAAVTRHTVVSDAVIVEIDAASLSRLRSWPWPRRYHAQALDRLREAGAAAVFYDIDFSSPSTPENDRAFAAALSQYGRGAVMLPAFAQSRSQLAAATTVVSRPLEAFRQHAEMAPVNVRPDGDGMVRRVAGSARAGDESAVLAGLRMSGRSDAPETVRIDYAIDPRSFDRLSFADVVEGHFDSRSVRGRHVLVGATAIELGDVLPVPVYQSLPGIVVQALAYETLRHGELEPAPDWFELALILGLFAAMSWVFATGSWRLALLFVTAAVGFFCGLALLAYSTWHLLIATGPQAALLAGGVAFFLAARLEQRWHVLQHQADHGATTAMLAPERMEGDAAGTGVMVYQPDFAYRNTVRMAISTGLRRAIEDMRIHLVYQPRLRIGENRVIGAEALLRWRHPELGSLPPEDIIDVAESTGLIWPLTEWTLHRAIEDARCWQAGRFPVGISVNLSVRLLHDPTLAGKVTRCLSEAEFEPSRLMLEITERAIMADPVAAMKNAAALRDAGIRLSIDDFGTGYSSLACLKSLPASELKIDKTFVVDMLFRERDVLLIRSTIGLAHSLGLEVVAEGVESAAILAALRDLGCDQAQGFHVGRPVGAAEFGALVYEPPAARRRTQKG